MESDFDDQYEDECYSIYQSTLLIIELFTQKNREYFKLDPKRSKDIKKIQNKENEINLIIQAILKKYPHVQSLKHCQIELHFKTLFFELEHILDDNKRMINAFNREKLAKAEMIQEIQNKNMSLEFSSEDEKTEYTKKLPVSCKDLKNKNESKKDKPIESSIKDKNQEKTKFDEKSEKDQNLKTFTNINQNLDDEVEKKQIECNEDLQILKLMDKDIDAIDLDYILENQLEYQGDEEFRKELVKFKNQIQDLASNLEGEIHQSDAQLDSIAHDMEIVNLNVDEINHDLKEAAIEKNKVNKFKYPLIFGGIGTGIGSIVPGVGNIIGGSIGSAIGMYLTRLEKKQIDKICIEKNKSK